MPRAIGEMNERQANTRRLNALPLEKILEELQFWVSGDGITPREMMEPNRRPFVTCWHGPQGKAFLLDQVILWGTEGPGMVRGRKSGDPALGPVPRTSPCGGP